MEQFPLEEESLSAQRQEATTASSSSSSLSVHPVAAGLSALVLSRVGGAEDCV